MPPRALIRDIIGGRSYRLIPLKQRLKRGQRLRRIHDCLAVGKLGGIPIRRIRAHKRQLFGVLGYRFFHIVVEGGGKLALGVFLAHQRLKPLRETRDFPIPMRRLRRQIAEVIEYHGQRPGRARGGVGRAQIRVFADAMLARRVADLHHQQDVVLSVIVVLGGERCELLIPKCVVVVAHLDRPLPQLVQMNAHIVAQQRLGISPHIRHDSGELRYALHALRDVPFQHFGWRSKRIFVEPGDRPAFLHHASKFLKNVPGQVVQRADNHPRDPLALLRQNYVVVLARH